jgi:hypothetical protein
MVGNEDRSRATRDESDLAAAGVPTLFGKIPVACECHDPSCGTTLEIHEDDYRLARKRGALLMHFDHVDPTFRVVAYFGAVCAVVPRKSGQPVAPRSPR